MEGLYQVWKTHLHELTKRAVRQSKSRGDKAEALELERRLLEAGR